MKVKVEIDKNDLGKACWQIEQMANELVETDKRQRFMRIVHETAGNIADDAFFIGVDYGRRNPEEKE